MDKAPENMKDLLGKTPQEVTESLGQLGFSSRVVYTRDTKDKEDNVTERVIRIKSSDYGLEILVGFFKCTSV